MIVDLFRLRTGVTSYGLSHVERGSVAPHIVGAHVAFGEGEKELYVTVVKDPKDSQAKGSIVKIANVK